MIAAALLLLLLGCGTAAAQDSSSALRRDLDTQLADGLSDGEAQALLRRGLALGREASSPSELFNAVAAVAAVGSKSSAAVAREIRASALTLLAERFHDSRRWSTLLVEGFLPDFDRLPQESWRRELEQYEATLEALAREPRDAEDADRLAAELLWAHAYARIHLDRESEWLSEAQRAETLTRLQFIVSRFGELPVPGSHADDAVTVGDRARNAIAEMRSLGFGTAAPATSGLDLEGNEIDLADHRGRVVVLDFWTSFCTPCLVMVPHTKAMMARLSEEAVSFIGVCGDETQSKGRATAKRVGMEWPSLWDAPRGAKGPIASAWHVSAWPAVYVLDAEGRIRFKFRSREAAEAGLEAAVRELLAERE